MAVLPKAQTPAAAAATMDSSETKRSKKRPIKPSSDSIHSNVKPTHSQKKKRRTPKHASENHTDSNSIATKEDGGVDGLKLGVCAAAKFYTDLLKHLQFDAFFFHGKMDKEKKGSSTSKFNEAENGILFTDVPVQSLQVSPVDWTVIYDPLDVPLPQGWSSNGGNILTFLVSNELKYLEHLQESNVQVVEYKFENKKLSRGEPQLEKLVEKNHHLYTSAVKAYRSYILAYNQHSMKDIFDVDQLDLVAVAASFCFSNPPKVHLK